MLNALANNFTFYILHFTFKQQNAAARDESQRLCCFLLYQAHLVDFAYLTMRFGYELDANLLLAFEG